MCERKRVTPFSKTDSRNKSFAVFPVDPMTSSAMCDSSVEVYPFSVFVVVGTAEATAAAAPLLLLLFLFFSLARSARSRCASLSAMETKTSSSEFGETPNEENQS